ncbi:NAD-dependent epimerase/dehydratase family protein [Devosia sp.]|uniref:NAD-dependent epimerase/dehydratase family protein n=1 Tax=Devosia sp. TaxID=1871048 RepID=UPI003A91A552
MAGKIAIAGASGLVGANILKAALARGYAVNGAMRDPSGPADTLMALPGADERLQLFAADMTKPQDFDPVVQGVDGVFIACLVPVYAAPDGTPARELDDARGWAEIIQPTVDGCLNIMRSAIAAGVRDIVICSSTSSTNPVPPVPVKNEVDHWSDAAQQCAAKKYTSATKTVMEHQAMALAAENGVRLRILLPTLMLGPALLPAHAETGFLAALRRMLRGEKGMHDQAPDDSASMAHIDDIAALFLAAYESPTAEGRYYAVRESWHWNDIYRTLHEIEPALAIPPLHEGPTAEPTRFDFTRRDSLGVTLRDIPDILADTVAWVRANP